MRRSVFGVAVIDERPTISNDVDRNPLRVGQPPWHPLVRTFLGVPLRAGSEVIGMSGVANKPGGYDARDERLLATFANQVAVAIDNARLYERSIRAVHRGDAAIAPEVAGDMLTRMRGRGGAAATARPALNETQTRILRLMSDGLSNSEIAGRVHLSENTVKTHVQEIFRRLEVRNRVEAAMRATRQGLI